MSSEVWERMTHMADGVSVVHPCHAGLAAIGIRSLGDVPCGNAARTACLLITRFDKIVNEIGPCRRSSSALSAETEDVFLPRSSPFRCLQGDGRR